MNMKKAALTCLGLWIALALSAQEYRTIDGSLNNYANPSWGSVNAEMPRLVPADYADGISAPNGINRPNPRDISNTVFSQSELKFDKTGLSDYVWAFGQFIDHDFSLVFDDPAEAAIIAVPTGDPDFDPQGEGLAIIPMFRSQGVDGSGVSPFEPREYANALTSYIDASVVYGSDEHRAAWLRSFQDGKLKVSSGNLLPWNTISGEIDDAIDPTAPEMGDDTHLNDRLMVAGDVRANENVLLLSLHVLFVREHNRRCDELLAERPNMNDEELYQEARRWVGALLQSIVYNEWLPSMGVELEAYDGYDPFVNATINNEFSAAAFRLGHTMINSEIPRIGPDGLSIPEGPVSLRDAFFTPRDLLDLGIDPMLRGMSVQVQQDMDNKLIDDLRNFLFGQPGAGGLDLAAININRGRERGLGDFNATRGVIGLLPYTSFEQIHSDAEVYEALTHMYGNVNNVDLWTGLLAEEHLPGKMLGETLHKIMEDQFRKLRDGDRFFYLNDPAFTQSERDEISGTKLSMIIERNSGVSRVPSDVFRARSYDDIVFEDVPLDPIDFNATVFPNPAVDFIGVKLYLDEAQDVDIVIYDGLGKVAFNAVHSGVSGVNTITIDQIEHMRAGSYLIQVFGDRSSVSKTLIVR